MGEEQRGPALDGRGQRKVVVTGDVEEQPGDARPAAVGLLAPARFRDLTNHSTPETHREVRMRTDKEAGQVHGSEPTVSAMAPGPGPPRSRRY